MNVKKSILENIGKLKFEDYDQNIKGHGHYDNLCKLICNLLNVGFTVKETQTIIDKLPINNKDVTVAERWARFLSSKKQDVNIALNYFQHILNMKFENIEVKPIKHNILNLLLKKKQNQDYKTNSKKLKEFLDEYELKYLKDDYDHFDDTQDFIREMFPDIGEVKALMANMNEKSGVIYNKAQVWEYKPLALSQFTHWCINRPYLKEKAQNEGVAESDMYYARYFLIEVDEDLTVDQQKKLADLMIDAGVPVKMVTFSGGRSIHIIVDLKIEIFEKLRKKGLLSGLDGVPNNCNISFRDYLDRNICTDEIGKYFKCDPLSDTNEYYKLRIKNIFNLLKSAGINVDKKCNNLQRWTRLPQGIRSGNIKQTLLYLRRGEVDCLDSTTCIENFIKLLDEKSSEKFNKLLDL